jgi:acyl carrier protein
MSTVEERVFAIVGRIAKKDPSQLKAEQNLTADLGIDSPRALELLCDLEEQFNLEVPEDAVGKIETINDILQLVKQIQATPVRS